MFGFIAIALAGILVGGLAQAQSNYVYRISSSCPGGRTSVMTGFRVERTRSITTAFHGLAGCQRITAVDDSPTHKSADFEVAEVDIDRDSARLRPRLGSEPLEES